MKPRRLLLPIAAAAVLVTTFAPPSGVDAVTGATKKKTKGKTTTSTQTSAPAEYFFRVTHCDGTMSIRKMTAKAAKELLGELRKERLAAGKTWRGLRKQWARVAGTGDFPIPPPRVPRCEKIARVPADAARSERILAKLNRRLDTWVACVVTDHRGERRPVALRQDGIYNHWRKVTRAYFDAVLQAGGKDAAKKFVRPTIKPVRKSLPSKALADRVVEMLRKKLDEQKAGGKPVAPDAASQ